MKNAVETVGTDQRVGWRRTRSASAI